MTLTEFLLARIADDEAVARAAINTARPGVHWRWVNNETDEPFSMKGDQFRASLRTVEEFPTTSGVGDLPAFPLGYVEAEETYALPHVARHDPARVLAECEAKRRIVEGWADPFGTWTAMEAEMAAREKRRILALLALPYADHPDYDEAWAPA